MENGKVKHSKERADQISGGVFMIGLALLFITHWWWPGIMFVIGATIIARTMAEGKDWTTATPAFWVIGIGVVFGLPGLIGGIDWATIWPLGLIALGLFMLFVEERAARTLKSPVRYGPEDLAGMEGDVRVPLRPDGQVWVDGGLWQARLVDPDDRLGIGEKVTVIEVKGLTLIVGRQTENNQGAN